MKSVKVDFSKVTALVTGGVSGPAAQVARLFASTGAKSSQAMRTRNW